MQSMVCRFKILLLKNVTIKLSGKCATGGILVKIVLSFCLESTYVKYHKYRFWA